MKRSVIVEVIAALFILFFLHTAVSNFLNHLSLRNLFGILPFTYVKPELIAWVLPSVELIVTIFLVIPRTRLYGLIAALTVLVILTLFIALTPGWPHDFGGVVNELTYQQHLVLMVGLVVLGVVGLVCWRGATVFSGSSDKKSVHC